MIIDMNIYNFWMIIDLNIYNFWSADTNYFTTSKSLKKAQQIGHDNMQHWIDTHNYLEDTTPIDEEFLKGQCIPDEVRKVTKKEFIFSMKIDKDTLILDDQLYQLID